MALPGNHDVGDEPPGQDSDQIIDEDRLTRWDSSFATDRWALDAGGRRLIGVNAQLFGSGLAREHAQVHWLNEQLTTAGRPTALFLHKPLFLESPTDDLVSPACMVRSARTRLLDKLNRSDVRLIVSGHLHQHRDRTMGICRCLCRPPGAWRRWPLRRHGARFLTRQGRGHNRTSARADLARPRRDQGSRPPSVPARYASFSSAPRRLS